MALNVHPTPWDPAWPTQSFYEFRPCSETLQEREKIHSSLSLCNQLFGSNSPHSGISQHAARFMKTPTQRHCGCEKLKAIEANCTNKSTRGIYANPPLILPLTAILFTPLPFYHFQLLPLSNIFLTLIFLFIPSYLTASSCTTLLHAILYYVSLSFLFLHYIYSYIFCYLLLYDLCCLCQHRLYCQLHCCGGCGPGNRIGLCLIGGLVLRSLALPIAFIYVATIVFNMFSFLHLLVSLTKNIILIKSDT